MLRVLGGEGAEAISTKTASPKLWLLSNRLPICCSIRTALGTLVVLSPFKSLVCCMISALLYRGLSELAQPQSGMFSGQVAIYRRHQVNSAEILDF